MKEKNDQKKKSETTLLTYKDMEDARESLKEYKKKTEDAFNSDYEEFSDYVAKQYERAINRLAIIIIVLTVYSLLLIGLIGYLIFI